jgi:hypothetical protein
MKCRPHLELLIRYYNCVKLFRNSISCKTNFDDERNVHFIHMQTLVEVSLVGACFVLARMRRLCVMRFMRTFWLGLYANSKWDAKWINTKFKYIHYDHFDFMSRTSENVLVHFSTNKTIFDCIFRIHKITIDLSVFAFFSSSNQCISSPTIWYCWLTLASLKEKFILEILVNKTVLKTRGTWVIDRIITELSAVN